MAATEAGTFLPNPGLLVWGFLSFFFSFFFSLFFLSLSFFFFLFLPPLFFLFSFPFFLSSFLFFSFFSFHWRISNGLNSSSHQQFNKNCNLGPDHSHPLNVFVSFSLSSASFMEVLRKQL